MNGTWELPTVNDEDVVFLAHFTGSGIDAVLDMDYEDYCCFLEHATKMYKKEMTMPRRVILSGIET